MVRHQGKPVIALGVSMAKGGDIIRAGQGAAGRPWRGMQAELPVGIEHRAGPGPAARGDPLGRRIRQGAGRGGADRAGGQLHQPGPAHAAAAHRHLARPGGRHHDPAGAGDHLRDDVLLGRRAAQDLAGQPDHRAGPAGRRRHHRGRDDGAQARGGLRQSARRHLRLRADRDADAHRHADHRGRLPAHRPGASRRPANTPSRSSP